MSTVAVNEITDEVGTGAPAFPNGMSVTGAALTDPEITGGIYLGGTGSANYLEDYEEGTFTFSFDNNPSIGTGYYTKTGRNVFVWGSATLTSDASGDGGPNVFIGGLPFSSSSLGGSIAGAGFVGNENKARYHGRLFANNTIIDAKTDSGGALENSFLSGDNLMFSATYSTDA